VDHLLLLDRLGDKMQRVPLALLLLVLDPLYLWNDWELELSRALLGFCPMPLGLGDC
jgi:hypothetical protein